MVITVPIGNNLLRLGELELQGSELIFNGLFECMVQDTPLDIVAFADCDEAIIVAYQYRFSDNPEDVTFILVRLDARTILKGIKNFIINNDPNTILGAFVKEITAYSDYIDDAQFSNILQNLKGD